MKKIIYSILTSFVLSIVLIACADTMDEKNKNVVPPKEKTEEYLSALRAFKKADHPVSFGWFGGMDITSPSRGLRLSSVPDSVDIISLWGRFSNLTVEEFADLRYVQEKLGTKVTYTIFAHEVPEPFEATLEGMAPYAKALADTMYKYGYDGIDLDYEPGFGGSGPLVGHDVPLMTEFIKQLGKYFGPKSGTDKLFMIDGVPYAVDREVADYFDYGIVQAYSSSGEADLQSRFNYALRKGWKASQYIFAENFEKSWSTGGVDYRHRLESGRDTIVESLIGMAMFKPVVNGEKQQIGGCGTYHMEYEYKHTPDYKYLRQAIEIMNPSKK